MLIDDVCTNFSDVWLGKFKTIFILSIIYAIGTVTLSVSAIPTLSAYLSPKIALIIGLVSKLSQFQWQIDFR